MHRSGGALLAATFVALAFVASWTPCACAQAVWLDRSRPSALMIEYLYPTFGDADPYFADLEGFRGVFFLTGRTSLSPNVCGVGEISLAIVDDNRVFYSIPEADPFAPDDGAVLGSPYFGVEIGRIDATLLLEAGVRVPIDESNLVTTSLALGADLERQSAWYDDAITTRAGARVRSRPASTSGLWVEARLAPEFVWDLNRSDDHFEATYGATARITKSWVRGGFGIGGRAIFEPPDDDDTFEANHVIEAAADFLEGAFRPGFSLRFPFDGNLGEAFDRTFGLQLTYAL